jgi:DNA-binding response OmpR family regulator
VKFLIVEDEKRMVELLRRGLTEEGHVVDCAFEGNAGFELARTQPFDAIILDIMLPKLNGYEFAKRLRAEGIATPVLMLTAKDTVPDIVRGLDLGADDYVTKPFSFHELLARLHAIQRRACVPHTNMLQVADLILDSMNHGVSRDGMRIALTRTEYKLLEFLMCHNGQIVPRPLLIESIWGSERAVGENTLDAFIRLLRHKIDDASPVKLIHTVRGVGYTMREGWRS